MNLPIPSFHEVLEVYNGLDVRVLIAPDPNAGRRGRYSVLYLNLRTGRMICIGRELPLKLSRKIATDAFVTCPACGQPMLPPGVTKRPNEYDHASGCPLDGKRRP